MRAIVHRLRQLEAHREQTLEAEVRRLERTPRVDAYMQAVPDRELRLLALGDAAALARFAAVCPLEGR